MFRPRREFLYYYLLREYAMNLANQAIIKEEFVQMQPVEKLFPKLVLLMGIACLALTGCAAEKEKSKEKPPAPVTVAVAGQKSVPVELQAIGNVEAYATVAVQSMVAGTVTRVHFREGEEVAKGAPLFTIDPRPFEAALAQAKANLAREQARAAHATEQARRYAQLWHEGIVTREQYDQMQADSESLLASVASLRAAVDSARLRLEYCHLRAPMAGRTGDLAVHAGNLVKENDTPLVTINQVSPLYVSFSVPEKELSAVKARMGGRLAVRAVIPDSGLPPEEGVITFLDNSVDPTTGTIRVKGTFPNGKGRLWPGQFVNLHITMEVRKDAVVVPTRAIQTGQQGEYVYLVKADQTVELRPVATGAAAGELTVVEKGVQPGDTVVTDGQLKLAPGGKISVKKGSPS